MRVNIFFYSMALIFFLTRITLTAADNTLNLPVPEMEEEEPGIKRKIIERLHNWNSPKHVGYDDPHFPSFMKFKPTLIPLPPLYKLPKEFPIRDDKLDLKLLTPQVLEKVSSNDLRNLLTYLSSVPVKLQWSDQKGHAQSGKKHKIIGRINHWEKSNAAAALCILMGTSGQKDLFTKMLALTPEPILPQFKGHMPALLNVDISAQVMSYMLLELDHEDQVGSASVAKLITFLTYQGINYWVNKDITKLNHYLKDLLEVASNKINFSNPKFPEQMIGTLIGSVLSGAMKRTDEIKEIDEKRIWLLGLIANLVWATTTFIGMAPIAAPIVAATAGGLSVGAVISTTALNALEFPRDFSPTIWQILGSFKMAILEATRNKDVVQKCDACLMLHWMEAAINVNAH